MAYRVRLDALDGDAPVKIVEIEEGNITFGREPENGIALDSDSVSRRHGCVFSAGSSWFYRDLGSTNGSWINGIRVHAERLRILRSGDVIQLADFPMRFERIGTESDDPSELQPAVSLLVFESGRFCGEFPFTGEDSSFVVGGPDGHMVMEGAKSDTPQLEIRYSGTRLHLNAKECPFPIVINGLSAVSGETVLSDRDEIDIGEVRLVVNNTGEVDPEKDKAVEGQKSFEKSLADGNAGFRLKHTRSWDDDDAFSQSGRGRVGVDRGGSGSLGGINDTTVTLGTMSSSNRESPTRMGFDLSSSQRFSGVWQAPPEHVKPGVADSLKIIVGAVVFSILLAVVIYYSLH